MKTRVLAAIPIALILIAALILQSWVLFGLVVVLAFIAQKEMLDAVSSKGEPAVRWLPYTLCGVMPAIILLFGSRNMLLLIAFTILFMVLFIVSMFSGKYNYKNFRNTLVAMLYPQLLFVFVYLLIIQYTN